MSVLDSPHPVLRVVAFGVILLAMLAWERCSPRRSRVLRVRLRWTSNLGLGALNALLLVLIMPALMIGAATLAQRHEWGVLNRLDLGTVPSLIASVLLLDLVVYFQHRLFHSAGPLWRLHRVHHSDVDFDATTGMRFHPGEALLSMLMKSAAAAALGAPVGAVVLFEIVLNGTALFNHGNVRIPPSTDRWLRYLLVTPDMHRVHHSVEPAEFNRNFGFSVPWWDYCFGTYQAQPHASHERMAIGLRQFRDPAEQPLHRLLTQPVR